MNRTQAAYNRTSKAYIPPAAHISAAQATRWPTLLLAIAKVESNWNEHAVGSLGELGPLQLRPEFFPVSSRTSLTEHYRLAGRYLESLYEKCAGLGENWIACYNLGPVKAKKLLAGKTKLSIYTQKVRNAHDDYNSWSAVRDYSQVRYVQDALQARQSHEQERDHSRRIPAEQEPDLRGFVVTSRRKIARIYA